MGTVNDILSLAEQQIGNDGEKYWNWYTDNINPRQGYYIDGYNTPYCAEYITWLLYHTNTDCIYFPSPTAFDVTDIHPSNRINKYYLRKGDILSYNFDTDPDGDHVGIVIDAYYWGVRANEGNVCGIVDIRDRYWDEILFGIRPKYSDDTGDKLVVDGIFGYYTVKELQITLQNHGFYLGYYLDGDFKYYTKLELQKYLQSKGYYKGYNLDGDFAYYSVVALQEYLRELGYYTEEYNIDGYWGEYTTRALQKALNDNRF